LTAVSFNAINLPVPGRQNKTKLLESQTRMTEDKNKPAGTETAPVKDDPIAILILDLVAKEGAKSSLDPNDVARAFASGRAKRNDPPDLWRKYLPAVRQQALHLARQGRLAILRKGKIADPHAPIKGLIRFAPPAASDDTGGEDV
jgi:hypothetical protein